MAKAGISPIRKIVYESAISKLRHLRIKPETLLPVIERAVISHPHIGDIIFKIKHDVRLTPYVKDQLLRGYQNLKESMIDAIGICVDDFFLDLQQRDIDEATYQDRLSDIVVCDGVLDELCEKTAETLTFYYETALLLHRRPILHLKKKQ